MSEDPSPAERSASKRERLKAEGRRLKAEAREWQRGWQGIAFPEGEPTWFEAAERIPAFDPTTTEYSASNAWWLIELARLAYTPDHVERMRPWSRMDREPYLARSPFTELTSIHKTGTHAAFYRAETETGTATVLCFRGTSKFRQWVLNLSTLPVRWGGAEATNPHETGPGMAYVHQGFRLLFDRIWPQIEAGMAELPRPLFVTGHSLGAALALMTAARCSPDVVYTFGSPRVGNRAFGRLIGTFPHYRVAHRHDIVTLLPHSIRRLAPYDFQHHGEEIHLRAGDGSWKLGEPLSFLAKSLNSPHPPSCFIDHTPTAYAEALVEEIEARPGLGGTAET